MTLKEQIIEALRDVLDPELGINIVDLGLVYEIDIDEDKNVVIKMTLTTPGCPMHDSISFGVQNRLHQIEEIGNIDVQLVWEPRWDPSRMSDRAKELLWGV
ncbi:metal-sulfur cluster assembly factor [Bacillus andreraoultii]|uniref:metal-sulfur cluster assembly factor n=1 Tax=Bacillus andreraoultii TaxID=1499685 RepID=UPI0005396145|nr:iron-sulfur cluster assembly protein [Bacillus andreraoultii]